MKPRSLAFQQQGWERSACPGLPEMSGHLSCLPNPFHPRISQPNEGVGTPKGVQKHVSENYSRGLRTKESPRWLGHVQTWAPGSRLA